MATVEGNAGARDIAGRRGAASRAARPPTAAARARRRTPIVPADADRRRSRSRRSCRRCSARSRTRIKSTDQITQAGTPLYPADPVTFSYQGKELPILHRPDATGRRGQLALFEPRPQAEHVHRSGGPGRRADRLGRARGGRSSTIWQFAPHWENFAKVWDLIDYPRLLFNTVDDRDHRDDRDAALVHARGVRVRALPVPRAEPPVHAADRDDLPAGGRDDHPDLHDLLRSSAGSGPGCRCWCRRSSPTPSTSS